MKTQAAPFQESSDHDLLNRWVKEKCSASFTALVRRYAPLVHGVASRLLDEGALRDDAAQLTFIELAKKSSDLLRHENLAGWLHRTTRQKVRNLNRSERRARRKAHALQLQELSHGDPSGCWQKLSPEIDHELAQLSRADQEVILQRYFIGLSGAELAGHLQLTENAAAKRLSRAMEKLRARLSGKHPSLTVPALTAAFSYSLSSKSEGAALLQNSATTWAEAAIKNGGSAALTGAVLKWAKLTGGCVCLAAVILTGTSILQSESSTSYELLVQETESTSVLSQSKNERRSGRFIQEENRRDEAGNYVYQVTGQVTDRFSGEPLEGVQVEAVVFQGSGGFPAGEARTNRNGQYQLTVFWKKKARKISILATSEGYSPYLVKQNGSGSTVSHDVFTGRRIASRVDEDHEVTLNFNLTRTSSIKGRLINAEGNPVVGYNTSIRYRSPNHPTISDHSGHSPIDQTLGGRKQSDADGIFELGGFPNQGLQGEEVILDISHPESQMTIVSKTYPVIDGIPLFQEIEIPSPPILKGKVLNASGHLARNCRISFQYQGRDWTSRFATASGADGQFRISLPKTGNYEVKVFSTDSFASCEGVVEVELDGEITLKLKPSKGDSPPLLQFQGLILRSLSGDQTKSIWTGDSIKPGGLLIDQNSNPTGWLGDLQHYRGQLILGFGDSEPPTSALVQSPQELAQVMLDSLQVSPIGKNEKFIPIQVTDGDGFSTSRFLLPPSEEDLKSIRAIARGSKKR